MRRFAKTIFGAIECCNIVATLFPRVTTLSQHYNPDWLAISDYDVIFTVLGGEYKAEQNRCRELGVLPKFHSKAFLKIHEYPSADYFEGKKRLHGV